ncbi:conserved hypothetical protein [Streptomyces viridosporus ATCC 14672]|uniref:Uncharacterized protein n=1 Tax=Streptomyces viridosporus (strain ATCC 14672 / DSM 40746 / JCM 4963 / KCTC 9882 / NRRL B-12104 / FH 1290) TaxID=566461 RepID=D5ZX74_STRV1|nr:conserved hypothetical protein [Streptomyces viridosporus ATCC 14672]
MGRAQVRRMRLRAGADRPAGSAADPDPPGPLPPGHHCAVDRWADEALVVLRDAGRTTGPVTVRVGTRQRLRLALAEGGEGRAAPAPRIGPAPTDGSAPALPVLPEAATYVLPDLELLRTGALEADRPHPLVASALLPGRAPTGPPRAPVPAGAPQLVECRGARHRIGLVDGVLTPLDHDPDEIGREEPPAALTGTPLACLQAADRAHRRPGCLEPGGVPGVLRGSEAVPGRPGGGSRAPGRPGARE